MSVRASAALLTAAFALLLAILGLLPIERATVRSQDAGSPIVIDAPPTRVGGCTTSVSHTLSASGIRACDTLSVTTRVASACTACPGGVNVVLVRTGSIPGTYNRVGIGVIDELERYRDDTGGPASAAVVYYDPYGARVEFPLSEDLDKARGAFSTTPPWEGYGGWERAATTALAVLRAAAESGEPRCDIIVFFANVKEHDGNPSWESLRQQLRNAGATMRRDDSTLMAYCTTYADECATMRTLPSSPRYFAQLPDTHTIPSAVRTRIGEYAAREPAGLRSAGVDVMLPTGLRHVIGTADPPLGTMITDALTTTLRWRWDTPMDEAELELSYTLRPATDDLTGTFDVAGVVDVQPRSGLRHTVPMPSLPLTVTEACALPSPPPPTTAPTETPRPTATPAPPSSTAPPTATPPATHTPAPRSAYLPVALSERCEPTRIRADVALVLDSSSSMSGAKLEAAKAAAVAFVGAMRLPEDRVGVATFDREARSVHALSGDGASLVAAIEAIDVAEGTRIDRGLLVGLDLLAEARTETDVTSVLVLLTDGHQEAEVERPVTIAADARAAGIELHVVGLGADVDAGYLSTVAGDARRLHLSPGPDDLRAVYTGIALSIPCPAGAYWGRRD